MILDCDPGHDDAFAIALAAGDPTVELVAITTVAGNQVLEKTTRNACVMCTLLGIPGTPVVAGCDRPLVRPLRTAPEFHGPSGLDGPPPVEPEVAPRPGHAVDWIVDSVMASPGEITLVATGPLTNVALALRKEPAIVGAVREVVLMGGAYARGNVTPAAEFNIFVDPEAAQVVFEAPWRLTMMGLELTHQATFSGVEERRLEEMGTPLSCFLADLMRYYRRAYRSAAAMEDPPVHDPCAVAYVVDPALFEIASAHVEVETNGTWTTGMTVTDFRAADGRTRRVDVGVKLDRTRFWDLVLGAVERAGARRAGRAPPTMR
ncbi:MAG TPA: nucleoside hydrolase [Acidimicrobiales bacterium]|nr:nucleoside hydrolase [Acidimicrobiales bacterium]